MVHRWAMTGVGVVLFSAAAVAQPSATQTVNSYTPAQAQQALAAARAAGYTGGNVSFAQAGNFFINASRGGQTYSLTVTPDGKLYAAAPTG
jgi:hypothetical protein